MEQEGGTPVPKKKGASQPLAEVSPELYVNLSSVYLEELVIVVKGRYLAALRLMMVCRVQMQSSLTSSPAGDPRLTSSRPGSTFPPDLEMSGF